VTQRDEPEGVLLADVGGTNMRFAVLRRGKLGVVAHMAVSDHKEFPDGVAAFMARQVDSPEAKGRMSGYLEAIPVYLIVHEDPAFIGLRSMAMRRPWNS
jgi:glucokinase